MAAPKNNQFWKARSKHGRDPTFATAEILWDACCEYFQWVDDNPLMASEPVKFQGESKLTEVPRMRAMTISGMCLFLDVSEDTWANYRKKDDFVGVTTQAERIIYTQKFTGAAADMLNPNIIARDLGLKDVSEREIKGAIGLIPIEPGADPAAASEAYRQMIQNS